MENAESLLKRYWGYESFRAPQREIIRDVLEGKDVFAVLPTGSGKSLCYQLPTLMKDGVCIVISPLIALMQDQVANLKRKGIKALFLQSGKSRDEIVRDFDNLKHGNYKFVYLSPEKLQSPWIQEKIKDLDVSLIAIDEAHCISQWGHDFRPSYMRLRLLSELLPGVPKIALTATATERVRKDISEQLELDDASWYSRSFNRANLRIDIRKTSDLHESLKFLLENNKHPGIVYVGTRKEAIHYSSFLNHHGIDASFFHGGLSQEEKSRTLQLWMEEKIPLMVATNAFGMGIDKSNVRKVIHCHLPHSPENYLQEIGRAGRDGNEAHAYLLYNQEMIQKASEWRNKTMADTDFTIMVYQKICDFFHVPKGERPEDEFDFSLESFCSTYGFSMAQCHAAIAHLEHDEVIVLDHRAKSSSTVKIKTRGRSLHDLASEASVQGRLVQLLLRKYGGIIEQGVTVSENFISNHLTLPLKVVFQTLKDLDRQGMIEYTQRADYGMLRFLVPREESFVKSRIRNSIEIRNRNKNSLARSMEEIVNESTICRIVQLGSYFGEQAKNDCGQCDVCRARAKNRDFRKVRDEILRLLEQKGPSNVIYISGLLDREQDLIVKTLEMMKDKGLLTLNLQNKIELKK